MPDMFAQMISYYAFVQIHFCVLDAMLNTAILKFVVLYSVLLAGLVFDVGAGIYLWRHFGERGNTRIPMKINMTAESKQQ